MSYRYYSTQRPVAPGGYPKPQGKATCNIVNFQSRVYVPEIGRQAWGYIEYREPLTQGEAEGYELTPAAFFA